MIDQQHDMENLARSLESRKRIAVDLEADSMFHYHEKACLLQISANGEHYIVDPLCSLDLSPLAPVFKTRGITKVFHGADYDIRCLFRDFGIEVEGLFDTQVAARFLGEPQTGLAALLESRFGILLEKKYQKKNWSVRPLPPEMLAYASGDTSHLLELAALLEEELKAKGRLSWVQEECALLTGVRPAPPNEGPLFLKFRGAGKLDGRTLAVLENILVLRDQLARKWNRPLFKVMGNNPILEMALKKPASAQKLASLQGFSPKQARLFGKEIIQAIQQAMETPEEQLPRYPRKRRGPHNPLAAERARVLKEWRDGKGRELAVDPSVILTNAQIQAMADAKPRTLQELAETPEIRKWQCKAFGKDILAALKAVP